MRFERAVSREWAMGVLTVFLIAAGVTLAEQLPVEQAPAAASSSQASAAGAAVPWRGREFLPLGVYWPGEYTFHDASDAKARLDRIDRTLADLARHHVNAVWLTHVSAADGAAIARLAARHGIGLVASLGELAGEVPHVRKGDHANLIRRTLEAWSDAPPPIAWGLGDELRSSYMHEMAAYAAAWTKVGQPVTSVAMAGDVPAASQAGFSVLCADIYPFFSRGNPNGPNTPAASTAYLVNNVARLRRLCGQKGIDAWFMGAIFQEPWGPYELDADGDIVYLPGGNAHFRMPAPCEVRWQTWSAVAAGAQGVFHFSLFLNVKPKPNAKPLGPNLPFAVKVKTDSGVPGGILYPDGRPTPQYEAMGECFGKLAKVGKLLKTLQPLDPDGLVAFHAKGWPRVGDVVRAFKGPGGTAYVVAVNGDFAKDAEMPINVAADVVGVVDLVTGRPEPLIDKERASFEPIGQGFRQVRLKLAPGDGTLLELRRSRTKQ